MRTPLQIGAALCLCIVLASGCRLMNGEADFDGNSLLQPARPSPDSVKMEIIWARFPADDPALSDDAWKDIDETQLEPNVRRELANNGLRVGIVNGKLPDAISRALKQGETSPEESSIINGETKELFADPIVRGRVRQMPRNQRFEVTASNVYPTLPLLVHGLDGLGGRTFQQAQAIYAMRVNPQPDQTALIELTPELHHGTPRVRFTADEDGLMYQAPMREREVFDRLRMNIKLAAGEMLVVMSFPDAGSRLGHYFHTVRSSDGPQQKLILIRLAEVPQSDTFASLNAE